MKMKTLATLGAATFGLALSASASFAASLEPGETMGLAALSPLPEGVFFVDNENYGKQDGVNQRLGVNIPVVVWSTPWSFYNTRIELIAAVPFAHLDGAVNQVSAITQLYGAIFAHDFGNGFSGGLLTGVRTPDPSANISPITGRTKVEADVRGGLYYNVNGFHFYETSWYTGAFGATNYEANHDSVGIDFSASKTFDKFEIGFIGFAYTDVNRNAGTAGKSSQVALGGEIGYDFGKVTVQAQVTRDIERNITGLGNQPKETRGWLRLIVPLYVAPTAPAPVIARY